jgi:lipoyl-dependent peroxiredoxin
MNTNQMSEADTSTQDAKLLYTAKAHTTGGREGGASRTSDGRLDVKFTVPGAPGSGTNPEQMFAVGWSACFLSAIKVVASKMKVKLPAEVAIDPEVDLYTGSDGYFLKARLNVSLPGVERQVAQSILDLAHRTCPYSKATRGNIEVAINLMST